MKPDIIPDNLKKNRILFKVIGSPNIGLGHVVRSIELAQEFKKNPGIEIFFYCNNNKVAISKCSQHFPVFFPEDGEETNTILNLIKKNDINLVIIDHMGADRALCNSIKNQKPETLIVALDSFDYSNTYVDIIINLFNHNLEVPHPEKHFSGKYYEGLNYAIIRDLFLPYIQKSRPVKERVDNILISYGGADNNHHTLGMMQLLQSNYRDATLHVIIGALYADNELISRHANNNGGCRVYRDVANIEVLMDRVDIGFVGPGTTLLELCSLGVPAVVTPQNEYEIRFSKFIEEKNACRVLTDADIQKSGEALVKNILQNKQLRNEMSKSQKRLIDGRGKERIVQLILYGVETI